MSSRTRTDKLISTLVVLLAARYTNLSVILLEVHDAESGADTTEGAEPSGTRRKSSRARASAVTGKGRGGLECGGLMDHWDLKNDLPAI